jgi:hypothetical protein
MSQDIDPHPTQAVDLDDRIPFNPQQPAMSGTHPDHAVLDLRHQDAATCSRGGDPYSGLITSAEAVFETEDTDMVAPDGYDATWSFARIQATGRIAGRLGKNLCSTLNRYELNHYPIRLADDGLNTMETSGIRRN